MPCERIGQQFSLGKVSKKGVELDLEKIADKYNAYFAKIDQLCSECYTADSCIQCIFNLPDLESDCPSCHGYTNKQNFEIYKARQMDFLRKHPEAYYRKGDSIQIMETTGPFMVTRVYEQFKRKKEITLLPADLVTPLSLKEVWMLREGRVTEGLEEKVEKAFAIHYFFGSWTEQTNEGREYKKVTSDR